MNNILHFEKTMYMLFFVVFLHEPQSPSVKVKKHTSDTETCFGWEKTSENFIHKQRCVSWNQILRIKNGV